MNKDKIADPNEAIEQIERSHPFPEYVNEKKGIIDFIAKMLLEVRPPEATLLDIGCGALDKTAVFQLLGYQCYAVDDFQDPWHQRQGNVGKLQHFADEFGVNLYVQDSNYMIPWKKGEFDVVTLFSVIEHLHESPRDLFNVVGEYLKPGGVLMVTTPNSVNLRKRLDVLRGRTNYPSVKAFYENIGQWRGHVREYTLAEVEDVITWSGFENVRSGTFHGMLDKRLHNNVLRAAYQTLCTLDETLKDSIYVVGRKTDDWQAKEADFETARESMKDFVPHAVV